VQQLSFSGFGKLSYVVGGFTFDLVVGVFLVHRNITIPPAPDIRPNTVRVIPM
jgi:hypothetical protein